MKEQFDNKSEVLENPAEQLKETPEFKQEPVSNEVAKKIVADLEEAGKIVSKTSEEIKRMSEGEMMKGKIESMPQNPAQERLFKNVGFDAESLAATKAEFSKLSSAEAYNKFQTLTLEKTGDFLMNAGKDLKPADKGAINLLLRVINSNLEAASMNKKGNALRPYSFIIDRANHKPDGYMVLDGLSKLYAKNGYDDRGFLARNFGSADVPFENFQKDLAEVLTDQQKEDIFKMAKVAEKNAKNYGGARAGITQTTMASPIFSSKTVDELL